MTLALSVAAHEEAAAAHPGEDVGADRQAGARLQAREDEVQADRLQAAGGREVAQQQLGCLTDVADAEREPRVAGQRRDRLAGAALGLDRGDPLARRGADSLEPQLAGLGDDRRGDRVALAGQQRLQQFGGGAAAGYSRDRARQPVDVEVGSRDAAFGKLADGVAVALGLGQVVAVLGGADRELDGALVAEHDGAVDECGGDARRPARARSRRRGTSRCR